MTPLFWLLDPWYFLKNCWRHHAQRDISKTQEQANQLMEDPEYQSVLRYADTVKAVWVSFFFNQTIAIGPIVSWLSMCCYYYID